MLPKKMYPRSLSITSEAVGTGHPDKICDQIADLILYRCLQKDANARIACEVFACNKLILIGGEITTNCYLDVVKTAFDILVPIGYNEEDFTVISNIHCQSLELNSIICKNRTINVGDQCVTVGFAIDETPQLMPLGFVLAHLLIEKVNQLRSEQFPIKRDMKSQVTITYDECGKFFVSNMLVSVQHGKHLTLDKIRDKIINDAMIPLAKKYNLNTDFQKFVNPGGTFIVGGPYGDTGLTGRKILVDNYGLYAHNGGGAFSGKDPTKVDRTGCYYARWIAKHIVASGIASVCEIQLSWMIGNNQPFSILVNCFDTNKVSLSKIIKAVIDIFSFDFNTIIQKFKLIECDFPRLSVHGHFGHDPKKFLWEEIDPKIVIKLQSLIKN